MLKADKICVDCGEKGVVERRRCKECAKEFNRQRAVIRYLQNGRHFFHSVCSICGKPMRAWRRGQTTHIACRYQPSGNYDSVFKGNPYQVRKLVKEMGIEIPKYHVVHHADENPKNNDPQNLWVMAVSAHNSLHRMLQNQRSLWLKNHKEHSEDCWNILRDHLTTAWLATTSAKVLKIGDIVRPAGEPLFSKEEASETMHGTP